MMGHEEKVRENPEVKERRKKGLNLKKKKLGVKSKLVGFQNGDLYKE